MYTPFIFSVLNKHGLTLISDFLVAIQIYTDGSTNKIMYSGKLY